MTTNWSRRYSRSVSVFSLSQKNYTVSKFSSNKLVRLPLFATKIVSETVIKLYTRHSTYKCLSGPQRSDRQHECSSWSSSIVPVFPSVAFQFMFTAVCVGDCSVRCLWAVHEPQVPRHWIDEAVLQLKCSSAACWDSATFGNIRQHSLRVSIAELWFFSTSLSHWVKICKDLILEVGCSPVRVGFYWTRFIVRNIRFPFLLVSGYQSVRLSRK